MKISILSSILILSVLPSCFQISASGDADCDDIEVPSDMKCIPGGEFIRGSSRTSINEDTLKPVNDESPEMKISVSTFLMDETEVTYSAYQECFRAGGCPKAGPNYRDYDHPQMPMVGANWFAARDYCRWKGKRLPTEAEWEKAARGEKGELYPWGNEPADCKKAIIKEQSFKENEGKGCGTGKTWDVKSRPAYRYGLYDMAGNSWEWVSDWYSDDYTKCGKDCAGKNPKGPCGGAESCPGYHEKIVKGGSWWWTSEYAAASNRRPHFPANKPFHHFGFRCAKDVAE